jgi:hypothetical protein
LPVRHHLQHGSRLGDGVEHVVEVVRQARGHSSQCVVTFDVGHVLLQLRQFRDVLNDYQGANNSSILFTYGLGAHHRLHCSAIRL